MGTQGDNPHIFLWHIYDQKLKMKNFFLIQQIMNLVSVKKCP